MADDKKNAGATDRALINLHEDYEVRHWCEKFKCTREELKAAVDSAGSSAKAVEEYFSKQ